MELWSFFKGVVPRDHEIVARSKLFRTLNTVFLRSLGRGATVHQYGSTARYLPLPTSFAKQSLTPPPSPMSLPLPCTSYFSMGSSDLDLCVEMPAVTSKRQTVQKIRALRNAVSRARFTKVRHALLALLSRSWHTQQHTVLVTLALCLYRRLQWLRQGCQC